MSQAEIGDTLLQIFNSALENWLQKRRSKGAFYFSIEEKKRSALGSWRVQRKFNPGFFIDSDPSNPLDRLT